MVVGGGGGIRPNTATSRSLLLLLLLRPCQLNSFFCFLKSEVVGVRAVLIKLKTREIYVLFVPEIHLKRFRTLNLPDENLLL